MKRTIKLLVSVAFAGIAGVLAAVEPASAALCISEDTAWFTRQFCPAPDSNRGQILGSGDINTDGRHLTLQVNAVNGNFAAQGQGFAMSGGTLMRARGPNGTCIFNAVLGTVTFSPEGTCNNGTLHRMIINFN